MAVPFRANKLGRRPLLNGRSRSSQASGTAGPGAGAEGATCAWGRSPGHLQVLQGCDDQALAILSSVTENLKDSNL